MKAKDLRGKNIEDIENDSEESGKDEDAVAAAYENISKRLESIRNGKTSDDSEDEVDSEKEEKKIPEVDELEEWKGPKPPAKQVEEDEEEEHELRKVKLNNLEDEEPKGKKEEEEEIDPLDEEEEDEKPAKKEWQPKEDDPLDEEEEEDDKPSKDEKEDSEEDLDAPMKSDVEETAVDDEPKSRVDEEDEQESLHSEVRTPDESVPGDLPADVDREEPKGPDTLDDLAQDSPFGRHEVSSSKNMEPEEELPYHRGAREEEEDYSIPNLHGTRQNSADMGYNAHPQRESVGQSYSPKGNMDGNDPNNFFSQHQNQAPKRANKFHLLILIIIGVVVIGFTVYILKGGFGGISIGTPSPSPSPSATATPEPTPTPTPEPEVERGNFTVRVLNGTTTSGLAKTVSDKLKGVGYKTSNPGNASDDDVEQTEVRVKEGTESAALFERLKLDLAPDYEAIKGDDLDSKVTYDAEVIIGAK